MIYLKLARWPNVLMSLFTQLIIIYSFLPQTGAYTTLNYWQIGLLVLATCLITASGNVINDIYDVPVDAVNKPEKVMVGKQITEKKAFYFYVVLTTLAVFAGFILSNSIDRPGLAGLFIAVSFGLYSYATTVKKILLAGNLLISFMVGMVVITTAVFELLPAITATNQEIQQSVLRHLTVFAIFAFLINFLREAIKDCQDIKGDHAVGRSSLPIFLGRSRAARVLAVYTMVLVIVTGYLTTQFLYVDRISLYYTIFLIIAPLMFIGLRLWTATNDKEFKLLSLVCKCVLLTGILGIAIIKFTV